MSEKNQVTNHSYLFEFGKEKENDPLEIMSTAELTGNYIVKLQEKYEFSPVFHISLLPMSKEDFKRWGFAYAKLMVKQNGKLLKYQEEAALSYTRFQNMTDEQWDLLKSDSIEDLTLYKVEKRDKGYSNVVIPKDIKVIIDKYFTEYNDGVRELHTFLRSTNKGCLSILLSLSIISLLIVISVLLF